MFYLIYGLENYLIKKNINKIIDELKVTSDEIINLDMNYDSINDLIMEASTINMFSTKKLIICDNSIFLSSSSDKNDNVDELIKYIENAFKDTYILFILREEKIDSRKKICKILSKEAKVCVCEKIESYKLNNYVMDYIRDNGYSISSKNVDFLLSKTHYELSNVINEIDKLFIYKDKDKKITEEDIEKVITRNIETNIFELTNAIIKKDRSKIEEIYKDLLLSKEGPIKLIITIANQFRLYLQVKIMRNSGYSEKEIVSTLKEHPYRINLAMNNNYTIEELKDNLRKLSKLEVDIITGKVDEKLGFEMYLLNI